jgi:hypothetical protein
LKTRQFS